ncbi:MAG: DUF6378 domain-containing protein [Planctomycetota bacterium]
MTTLCQQAHELITARQESYGDMVTSWRRIAQAASRRTGLELTAEDALWVAIEMKLRRDQHSPENPDHLRDAIGYLGILGQLRAESTAPQTFVAPQRSLLEELGRFMSEDD